MDHKNKSFSSKIGEKESRKVMAQKQGIQTIWYGLGMMGLVGWSIAFPTLMGVVVGMWLDEVFPVVQSWTLDLLILGLLLGCFNAWRWMKKEDKKIHSEHAQISRMASETKQADQPSGGESGPSELVGNNKNRNEQVEQMEHHHRNRGE